MYKILIVEDEELERTSMKIFLEENLLVTINTDNRMVSQTTLEKEFAFLREQYAVTREQEVQMTKNAIEVAFASDAVKERLWKKMYTFEK